MLGRTPLSYVLMTILLIGTVLVAPSYLYSQGYATLMQISNEQVADRTHLTTQMHELAHASQRNLTDDYTYWNDMIEFADGVRDDLWGKENLESGIETFDVDGIWVVDRSGAVRYGIVRQNDAIVSDMELPVDLKIVMATVASGSVGEFHRFIDGRLAMVMTAGLVPTTDADRTTLPQGYFVTLSYSDDEDLGILQERAGIAATIHDADGTPRAVGLLDAGEGLYAFELPVVDWDGTVVAYLRGERQSTAIATLWSQLRSERITNYLLLGLLSVLMSGFVWVNARARARAEHIAAEMTIDLKNSNASLEARIAERTRDLEDDITRRTAIEEHLKKRTEELQRMNRAMIDRELRIVELKRKLRATGEGVSR